MKRSVILAEREGQVILMDVATGTVESSTVPVVAVVETARLRRRFLGAMTARWHVEPVWTEVGITLTVRNAGGTVVLEHTFVRRIELATLAVTPDGRWTVHVQANNRASEVTVLDAQRQTVQTAMIEHQAPLAAFAIGIVFDPWGWQAAVSMERVDGPGAETWLLTLDTGEITQLEVDNAFALDWRRV